MNYLALGIVGHVDHGKTALVRALTGAETDRLQEEQDRGISIVLGYAHLGLPSGELGIIDAPGHERFIRTMIAGATGCEAILLVVDVNEGVKPQTIEHLEIARLLGIKDAVIAITKCDIAQPGRREETAEELEILLDGSLFESAPLVYTSSETGDGLDELRATLDLVLKNSQPVRDEGLAYLPIDRVFTMDGFGTVVTGTLRRGSLAADQPLVAYPGGLEAQVRELQSHGNKTDRVEPGHRTAVNVRGVSKEQLQRGDVLASPDSLRPTNTLDVEFELLRGAKDSVKHRQPLRILFGSTETFAQTHLLDRNEVAPGETAFIQLRFDEPVAPLHLEPFIVRFYSPMITIGGGRILDSAEGAYRRNDTASIERLRAYASGDAVQIVGAALDAAGRDGLDAKRLGIGRRLKRAEVQDALQENRAAKLDNGWWVEADAFESLTTEITNLVRTHHDANPTSRGLPSTALAPRFSGLDARALDGAVRWLRKKNELTITSGDLHLPSFTPEGALSEADRKIASGIESAFLDAGLTPPNPSDVVGNDADKLYRWLIREGVLVTAKTDARGQSTQNIVFHRDVIDDAKSRLTASFQDGAAFTASDAKGMLGTSRKYLIPLLELLDRAQFTRRNGDKRTLTGR
jgi:selenocysteine-specific elongation factor